MNKRTVITIIMFLVLTSSIGVIIYLENTSLERGYAPSFSVLGDVKKSIDIDIMSLNKDFNKEDFIFENEKHKGVKLSDILDKAQLRTVKGDVYLVGTDGMASKIDVRSLKKNYILFSKKNGWEAINLNHPISSNVKHIQNIIVVSDKVKDGDSLNFFHNGERLRSLTCGELYMMDLTHSNQEEGMSKMGENSVTVFTSHNYITVSELIDISNDRNIKITNKDGKEFDELANGHLEPNGTRIDFVIPSDKKRIEDIREVHIYKED